MYLLGWFFPVRPNLLPETFPPDAHREIFSKSYQINPKSDCIYHFLIEMVNFLFPLITVMFISYPNQSENGKYNLISG